MKRVLHHMSCTKAIGTAAIVSVLTLPASEVRADCAPGWASVFDGQESFNARVTSMAVFDDGTGQALYVGGTFTTAGGITVNRIVRWDGTTWLPLDGGVSGGWTPVRIAAMTVFDDGTGPALYVGGWFTAAGGQDVNHIAKWNGQNWSPLGEGTDLPVNALAVFDDGSGPALWAGGWFTWVDGTIAGRIAKWDGANWSSIPGAWDAVFELTVFDDGNGEALYAGGLFNQVAGGLVVRYIARWSGTEWSALSSGLADCPDGGKCLPSPFAMAVYDDGNGPALFVGGNFLTAGGHTVNHIARWSGTGWSSVGGGMNNVVSSLSVFDDGSGPALYASGPFTVAGGEPAIGIARWNGSNWAPLGSGLQSIDMLFADPVGIVGPPALYVGGNFQNSPAGDSYLTSWRDCAVECGPGDFNCDGRVDFLDLLTLLIHWGPCADPCPADLNDDGVVDVTDLVLLLSYWTG